MQYQSNSGSSIPRSVTRALLMLLFVSFTVCYIHYMECNFIALTQHILSEGHTHYSRLVGTVAITICAVAIQIGVSRLFRLPTIVYAVSYVPSALFLAAITDLIPDFSLLKLAVYILILIACVSFCIYRQQRNRQRHKKPHLYKCGNPQHDYHNGNNAFHGLCRKYETNYALRDECRIFSRQQQL